MQPTSLLLRYANSGMEENIMTPMAAAAAAAAAAPAGVMMRLLVKPAAAHTGMTATGKGEEHGGGIVRGLGL